MSAALSCRYNFTAVILGFHLLVVTSGEPDVLLYIKSLSVICTDVPTVLYGVINPSASPGLTFGPTPDPITLLESVDNGSSWFPSKTGMAL